MAGARGQYRRPSQSSIKLLVATAADGRIPEPAWPANRESLRRALVSMDRRKERPVDPQLVEAGSHERGELSIDRN